jgi:hypothetical protein
MANDSIVLIIGGLGLLLYALSTVDWSKVADLLNKAGILLFGGSILWALSKMN